MPRPKSSGTIKDNKSDLDEAMENHGYGAEAPSPPGSMVLPSEPTKPSGELTGKNIFIYGPPKIGKSTLASGFRGALFADTEGGLSELEVYRVPITDWPSFLQLCSLAVTSDFDVLVIDTVDMLAGYCRQHVNGKLGIVHESDLDFGKGWEITKNEFVRAIAKLTASRIGLVLISHSDTVEMTSRNQVWNKEVPTLSPKGMRNAALALSDVILYVGMGESEEGDDERMIFTKESKYIEAGERGINPRLPATIPWPVGVNGFTLLESAWKGEE